MSIAHYTPVSRGQLRRVSACGLLCRPGEARPGDEPWPRGTSRLIYVRCRECVRIVRAAVDSRGAEADLSVLESLWLARVPLARLQTVAAELDRFVESPRAKPDDVRRARAFRSRIAREIERRARGLVAA